MPRFISKIFRTKLGQYDPAYKTSFFKKLTSAMKINSKRKQLRLTKPANSAIQHARKEARELNHDYIGTEHLLLGILREETTHAAQLLQDHGVTLEKARRMIREFSNG